MDGSGGIPLLLKPGAGFAILLFLVTLAFDIPELAAVPVARSIEGIVVGGMLIMLTFVAVRGVWEWVFAE
jgi:hypothetical protein